MKINPKNGVDQLLFGMKQNHVEAIYGKPTKQFVDDDGNSIYLYYNEKLRLTFYEDEAFRLGYIITSNTDVTLLEKKSNRKKCSRNYKRIAFYIMGTRRF